AILVFERNAFERNGRLLMFGNFWKITQVVVPFGIAVLVAVESARANEWNRMIVPFLLTFFLLFFTLKFIRRVLRNFGFR
ncbi:MAG: hypothetical protein ACXVDE_03370, partial [Tumebacillaceae bacterium]